MEVYNFRRHKVLSLLEDIPDLSHLVDLGLLAIEIVEGNVWNNQLHIALCISFDIPQ